MPFNWNFGNDDLNNRQDRNNENRPAEPKGDPEDPPRDKLPETDLTEDLRL